MFDNYNLEPGDIVEVRAAVAGGTEYYYETVTPRSDDGGDINQQVILKVREGDTVIIDGQNIRDHAYP